MTSQGRDAWAAFAWHSAELALIVTLVIFDRTQPVLIFALVLLAAIGWAWSLAHLPGREA